MRYWAVVLSLSVCLPEAFGDGGFLRLSQEKDDLRISVFTSPTPPRVGTVDVSVLIQDLSGKVVLGLPIEIQASRLGAPEHPVVDALASHQLATNKLLQAAHLLLPNPGNWEIRVRVNASTEVVFPLELASAPPSWWPLFPWISGPFFIIGLFLLLQMRRRRVNT